MANQDKLSSRGSVHQPTQKVQSSKEVVGESLAKDLMGITQGSSQLVSRANTLSVKAAELAAMDSNTQLAMEMISNDKETNHNDPKSIQQLQSKNQESLIKFGDKKFENEDAEKAWTRGYTDSATLSVAKVNVALNHKRLNLLDDENFESNKAGLGIQLNAGLQATKEQLIAQVKSMSIYGQHSKEDSERSLAQISTTAFDQKATENIDGMLFSGGYDASTGWNKDVARKIFENEFGAWGRIDEDGNIVFHESASFGNSSKSEIIRSWKTFTNMADSLQQAKLKPEFPQYDVQISRIIKQIDNHDNVGADEALLMTDYWVNNIRDNSNVSSSKKNAYKKQQIKIATYLDDQEHTMSFFQGTNPNNPSKVVRKQINPTQYSTLMESGGVRIGSELEITPEVGVAGNKYTMQLKNQQDLLASETEKIDPIDDDSIRELQSNFRLLQNYHTPTNAGSIPLFAKWDKQLTGSEVIVSDIASYRRLYSYMGYMALNDADGKYKSSEKSIESLGNILYNEKLSPTEQLNQANSIFIGIKAGTDYKADNGENKAIVKDIVKKETNRWIEFDSKPLDGVVTTLSKIVNSKGLAPEQARTYTKGLTAYDVNEGFGLEEDRTGFFDGVTEPEIETAFRVLTGKFATEVNDFTIIPTADAHNRPSYIIMLEDREVAILTTETVKKLSEANLGGTGRLKNIWFGITGEDW